MKDLDVNFVRTQFPSFSVPEMEGKLFFDNAGGSYTAGAVISRLNRFYTTRKVQPYAPYTASRNGGDEMDEARQRMALMLNIPKETLHFGPSTSQNTYVLANAFRKIRSKRDTIVVTNQDHEANSGAWRRLEEDGFKIREWKINTHNGGLSVSKLIKLLDEKVLLVAFPHCSNIIGEINPVKEICKVSRAAGAYTCVDGVSYVPHGFPDISDCGADIYLFSSYKTYGPHLGIMYLSKKLNLALPCQGHFFNSEFLTKRFTPAGPDHAQIAASAGIVDYIESVYRFHFDETVPLSKATKEVSALQRRHEKKLLIPLFEYLETKQNIEILGSTLVENKVPTVSLNLSRPARPIAERLFREGVMTDGGDFYAIRLLEAMGINVKYGVLRLSFVHYTTPSEIDRLIGALDKHMQ